MENMTTRRRKYAVGGYEQIRANNTIDVHGFNIGLKKIVNTAVIFKKMLSTGGLMRLLYYIKRMRE